MRKPILILYYDTQWKSPLPRVLLPEGVEITADRSRYAAAQVVLFHIPEWKYKPRFLFPRKRPGQLWVAWSMECEANYPQLVDPKFMSAFDLTMTYRLDSDFPVIYFGLYSSVDGAVAELATPPRPKDARVPAAAFISSRFNRSGRREYMRELMRYLEIDSYGSFMNNVRVKTDSGRPFKLETLAHYKFTIAFENAIAQDYVTEKFYDPLIVGSVPVYLGAANVHDFAPGEHCYINVNDFSGPQALAAYLQGLLEDEPAYNAYLDWKRRPLRPAFLELVSPYRRHVLLNLCDWLESNPA